MPATVPSALVLVDLALNGFDADVPVMLDLARHAERRGVAGLWVPDHFSGSVVGGRWSRDPFVCLGAMAAVTDEVRLGPLVANVRNRHPAQLASAINSLASVAPGRVVLGMGSGAAPGSHFAVEHDAIGTVLGDAASRRQRLIDQIEMVRRLHDPDAAFAGLAVTDGSPCPPIVVGASAQSTVDAAVAHADGLNLRWGATAPSMVAGTRATARPGFEISVLHAPTISDDDVAQLRSAGADRIVIGVSAGDDWPTVAASIDRVIATT